MTRLQNDPQREARLVSSLRAGDAAAFEEMVRHYGPRLLKIARRIILAEEDARDCVQEAFLSVHRSIDKFGDRSSLGTWLHRIVTNAALMKLRSQRSRPEELTDEFVPKYDRYAFRIGPLRANTLTPDELLERADTGKMVREAMDRLPEGQRTVLLLRDIEGYTTRDTAQMLGMSDGAVKVRLHRARTALKELLRPLFDKDVR